MSKIFHKLNYNLRCDDCGVEGTDWQFGKTPMPIDGKTDTTALIPPGTAGNFCQDCYLARYFRNKHSEPTLPIGTTNYSIRGKGRMLVITFSRESVGVSNRDFSDAIKDMIGECKFEDSISTAYDTIDSYTLTWSAHLDHHVVNEKLNALRARFPKCTISYIKLNHRP